MLLSGPPVRVGEGKISPLPSSSPLARARTSRAASDSGTRCSRPPLHAFARAHEPLFTGGGGVCHTMLLSHLLCDVYLPSPSAAVPRNRSNCGNSRVGSSASGRKVGPSAVPSDVNLRALTRRPEWGSGHPVGRAQPRSPLRKGQLDTARWAVVVKIQRGEEVAANNCPE